jgi:hypothetical protein
MAIYNSGAATDFSVAMGIGDLGGTPLSRVNRVWYVHTAAATTAYMGLFFRKWDIADSTFTTIQDEVETGFDYSNIKLMQKDNSNVYISESANGDVLNELPLTTWPYNHEIYCQYTNVSDPAGHPNGLSEFTRFSCGNSDVILAVNIINITAYKQSSGVKVDWTSLYELDVDHYEVERSANGNNFITLGSVAALDNGLSINNYSFTDLLPLSGGNYYRIKAVSKDGSVKYTDIVLVNIGAGKPGFAIYPNPVTNHLATVQISNLVAGKYMLQIFDVAGQQLINQSMDHPGGSSVQQLNLPVNMSSGYYIVRFTNGKTTFTQSLVVE